MWASTTYHTDLVSVIIPTYNRANVLIDAMESVSKQTYRPVELVIVDDGSTDATEEVVASFLRSIAKDNLFSIRYVKKINEGCQKARNTGVGVSTGEFLQFLDSDDTLNEQKLANAVRLYRNDPAIDLVYSNWIVDNGRRLIEMTGPSPNAPSLLAEAVLHNLCIFSPVYRRDMILRVGPFNEELFEFHDVEYCMRVINITSKAARDDNIGGVYRLGKTDNSITGFVDPKTLRSKWHVNRWQKTLLQAESSSESKVRALKLLGQRAHSIASQCVGGGCPDLGLKIVTTEFRLWWPLSPRRTTKCLILSSRLLFEYVRQIFQTRL